MRGFDQFTAGFFRKLGYAAAAFLLLAISAWFTEAKAGTSTASASGCPAAAGCDQGEAFEACKLHGDLWGPSMWGSNAGPTRCTQTNSPTKYYCEVQYKPNGNWISCTVPNHYYGATCAARNASLGGVNNPVKWASSPGAQCVAGCKFQIASDEQTRAIFANGAGQASVQTGTLHGGVWEYSGDTCGAIVPNKARVEEKPKPECASAGDGRTYCIKPDGEYCATASTGRSFCWKPGEIGQKTDAGVTQTSTPGTTSPQAPEGSTHTNTTNITNTKNSSTSNTTINNYSTISGGPAGATNQAQPVGADGVPSGTTGGTTGEPGEGNDNTAGGGVGCDDPPSSTGDALLGAVYKQIWETRCAITKGQGALTGEAGCGEHGNVLAFACSGDSTGCATALRLKEAACKADYAAQQLEGDGAKDQGDGDGNAGLWGNGDGDEGGQLNGSLITLGGGQLFPVVDIEGQTLDLNASMDGPISMIRFIIIAMFSILAMFIAGGKP